MLSEWGDSNTRFLAPKARAIPLGYTQIFKWAIKDSNLVQTGYEPGALTNWANGPCNRLLLNCRLLWHKQHIRIELTLALWKSAVLTSNTNAAYWRQMEVPPPNGYSPSIRFQVGSWYSPSSSAKQIVTLSISDYFMRGRGIEPPIPYGQRFFIPLYVTIADFSLWAGLCLYLIIWLR